MAENVTLTLTPEEASALHAWIWGFYPLDWEGGPDEAQTCVQSHLLGMCEVHLSSALDLAGVEGDDVDVLLEYQMQVEERGRKRKRSSRSGLAKPPGH